MDLVRIRKNATKKIKEIAARTSRVLVFTLDNYFIGEERVFESTEEIEKYLTESLNGDICKPRLILDKDTNTASLRWHSNCWLEFQLG